MRIGIITLFVLASAVLLSACSASSQEQMTSNPVQVSVDTAPVMNAPLDTEAVAPSKDIEIYLEVDYTGNDGGCRLSDIDELQEKGDNTRCDEKDYKESFFPQTYTVAQGDHVKLVFMLPEPHVIGIEGYDSVDEVQNDIISFYADKTGRFSVTCYDCHNQDVAEIIVE